MSKEGKPKWSRKKEVTRIIFHKYCVPTMMDDNIVTDEELTRIASFLESDDPEMGVLGESMLEALYEAWKIKSENV